jgi:nondiscriminating glutamyl-tRNA synthetase
MEKFRVRFAPSPTGPLHIGGARSALFNYLLAKQKGGDFILRIEDTDLERSSRESEENIKASLKWLGIDWNEGIDVGGDFGPYRQTERLDLYKQAIDRLLEQGDAYYCYCTEEEVAAEKEQALKEGKMPNYSGRCYHLTEEEKAAKIAAGIKPVIRFHVKDGDPIVIHDMVRGDVSFDRAGIGDFVIVKSDGIPVYNFAVVVDDHTMQISHVIRGEEHLSNTPRQAVLYEALGWEMPTFGHISLILGKDRTKMSKRNGDVSVVDYQQKGYLPEAIVNFLALLGWSPEGEEEMFTLEQLVEAFSMDRVSKSPAVFDIDKLKWLNGQYLRKLPEDKLLAGFAPYIAGLGLDAEQQSVFAQMAASHVNTFAEAAELIPLFSGGEVTLPTEGEAGEILAAESVPQVVRLFAAKLNEAEVFDVAAVKTAIKQIRKETKLGGKKVFMPLRLVLTGAEHGPDLDKLAVLMGKPEVEKRLAAAAVKLGFEL